MEREGAGQSPHHTFTVKTWAVTHLLKKIIKIKTKTGFGPKTGRCCCFSGLLGRFAKPSDADGATGVT